MSIECIQEDVYDEREREHFPGLMPINGYLITSKKDLNSGYA